MVGFQSLGSDDGCRFGFRSWVTVPRLAGLVVGGVTVRFVG